MLLEAAVTKVVVRTEQELRAALEKGEPVIEVPAGVEIELQATRSDAQSEKEPVAGEEGEEGKEEEDRDEGDEEDDLWAWDCNPLCISSDVHLYGAGDGAVIRQTMCAPCGCADYDALVVKGARHVTLEGLIFDKGTVRVSEGASLTATRCTIQGGRWYADDKGSCMHLRECGVEGSIGNVLAVWGGARIVATKSTFSMGGCWAPANIEVVGEGSTLTLADFTITDMLGELVISLSDGASAVVERGSIEKCGAGIVAKGKGSHLDIRDVSLTTGDKDDFEIEGDRALRGIAAIGGAKISIRGGSVAKFHYGIVASCDSEVVVIPDRLPELSENHVDYVRYGNGELHGVEDSKVVTMLEADVEVDEGGDDDGDEVA